MKTVQLDHLIDLSTPELMLNEVKKIFLYHYPAQSFYQIEKNFSTIRALFKGSFKGYRACNTEYHNLYHTMDTLLAAARILDGRNLDMKIIGIDTATALLNAALLHDTGYIQEDWDIEGTGAKYTTKHIERSIAFLYKHRKILGLNEIESRRIERIIMCTGLNADLDSLPFNSAGDRLAGRILASADLIGQMADRAYLEKLIFLYYELKEAGIKGFDSEFDIIRKTIDFYEMVLSRLNGPCVRVYKSAQIHFRERFAVNSNLYIDSIRRHIAYLYSIFEDDTTNFRTKLKRKVKAA